MYRSPLGRDAVRRVFGFFGPFRQRKNSGRLRNPARRPAIRCELLEDRSLPSGTYTGLVFQDFDANGKFDTASTIANSSGIGSVGTAVDRGLAGITVTAYGANNVVEGTTTTGANGQYSLNAVGTGPFRIEFTNLPAGFYVGPVGPNSHTTVQFVPDGGASGIDLGLVDPSQYSTDNPFLVTQVYTYSDNVNGPYAGNAVLDIFPYAAGSNSPSNAGSYSTPAIASITIPADEIGSTFGLAYNPVSNTIYASAFMKRHAGFGPDGTGAIYAINATTGAVSLFADLNAVFGANTAGANLHDQTNYDTDNGNIGWNAVGTTGLGGMTVSPDGKFVYVMNLADRSLYKIPTSGPLNAGTIVRQQIPLNAPNSTGVNGADLQPFAVEWYNNQIYVGIVNSAETTQNRANLWAYVYTVNPATLQFSAAPAFQFQLNYPRAAAETFNGTASADWLPWSTTYKTIALSPTSVYPQPEFTSLTFDVNGNMVIGLRDRNGDQTGFFNESDPTRPTTQLEGVSAGDILRAGINVPGNFASGWTLESNSSGPGFGPTAGAGDNEGPGGGRFYYQDTFTTLHQAITVGGVAQLPGFPDVVVTSFDPGLTVRTGGVNWYNNTTGVDTKGYQIYDTGNATPPAATFSKAAGIGDLIALTGSAPLEIGNRIWLDSNGDGIQDPNEPGIANVTVQLYQNGNLVGTTTTAADGTYYFNAVNVSGGVLPNTAYEIRIAAAQAVLAGLRITQQNVAGANPGTGSTFGLSGGNFITDITTGGVGDSNQDIDGGFIPPASIGQRVWLDTVGNDRYDAGEPGVSGVTVRLYDGSNNLIATTTTNINGIYGFNNLAAGTYTVVFDPTTLPAGTAFVPPNAPGSNAANASDADPTTGAAMSVTLVPGENDLDVNAGIADLSSLAGHVYVDNNNNGVLDAGEPPIGGVTLTLTGTDDLGDPVSLTTTTALDGTYSFDNLRAGTYAVSETQPAGYLDGQDAPGTPFGGSAAPVPGDIISGIDIYYGAAGTNYNFGELPTAALSLTKIVNDPTPNVGEVVKFTIALSNAGPSDATNVAVTDLLPPGLTFENATASAGSYNPATGVWTVASLPNGDTETLMVSALVVSPAAETNIAEVTASDQADPNGDPEAMATVMPQIAALTLTKTVDNPTPNVGQNVTFTVTLSNAGPNDATDVSVHDLLPAGLTLVKVITSAGSYDPTSGVWTVGTITDGDTETLVITALVVSPAQETNVADVTASDQYDPNGDEQATATVTPQIAALTLTKVVDNSTPNVGQNVTFTVSLSNAGPNDATDVAVRDLLPAGLSLVSATPSIGRYDPATGLWTVGTVTDGDTETLQIVALVVSPLQETNVADVTASDQYDPNGDEQATATVTPQIAALTLTKVVNNAAPNVGQNVTFTVTLSNAGPNDATDVTVQDLLPAGLALVSATPSIGSYDPANGVWSVGTVVDGDTEMLQIVALVNSPLAETNFAEVTASDQYDPNGDESASATVTPQIAALTLTKVVNNAAPTVGQNVTFTVTLSNAGPNDATDVAVRDLLPAGLTLVNATPSQGSYDSATGVWTIGTVADGNSATLQVVTTVTGTGTITNLAQVTASDQYDPNGDEAATASLLPQSSLAGQVYYDQNNNGKRDGSEPAIAGVTITLTGTDSNGAVHLTTTTLTDGSYQFTGLLPGTYTISETQPTAYLDGKDRLGTAGGTLGNDIDSNIALAGGVNGTGYDFGELLPASISGYVYVDMNKNGVQDPGEPGIPGTTVTLTGTDDLGQSVHQVGVTGMNGSYNFTGLRPGNYVLKETQPSAFANGLDKIGTQGGVSGNDIFTNAILAAGQSGKLNDYGEIQPLVGPPLSKQQLLAATKSQAAVLAAALASGVPTSPMPITGLAGTHLIAVGADAGGGPRVRVYNAATGKLRFDFYAYNPSFTGGVRVAVGDVTGDGVPDIITAAGVGGGPDIKVFDGVTGALVTEFFAYAPNCTGGVYVAVGDLDGSGKDEIVTGAGAGGGPEVRVWKLSGSTVTPVESFYAYAPSFAGGVRVATGDLQGTGKDEVITGAGPGGGPQVEAFQVGPGTVNRTANLYAFGPSFTNGVFVASADVNGDGKDDIIVSADAGNEPLVNVFDAGSGAVLASYLTAGNGLTAGVRVAAADINGTAELLTGYGAGVPAFVQMANAATGQSNDLFDAFDPGFLGGVFVAMD